MFPWFHTLLGGNGLRRDGLRDRRSNRRRGLGNRLNRRAILDRRCYLSDQRRSGGWHLGQHGFGSQRRICLDGPDLTADQAHACFTGTNA